MEQARQEHGQVLPVWEGGGDRALVAAAEAGDHATYRKIRQKQAGEKRK